LYSTQIFPSNPDIDTYSGLELVVGLLAKHFTEKGHDVHLFACKNSYFSTDKDGNKPKGQEKGHLYAVGEKGTHPVHAWNTYWNDERSKKVLKEADIVCDHSWNWYPYIAHKEIKNLCHVEHGPNPSFKTKPPMEKPNYLAVSHTIAKLLTKWSGVPCRGIQNGIPLYKYPYNPKPLSDRNRILWLSRIYFPKGCHRVIEIANKLKIPIDIAGGSFGQIPAYVEKIDKMCKESEYVTWHGHIPFKKKLELYQNAKCVVLPIIEQINDQDAKTYMGFPNAWEWNEPFGLVTAEAGACGTPTIVTPNGGWPESMIHGYNGYHANTDEEFMYYIKQIDQLEPKNCRTMAEKFDYKIMGENYLKIFQEIIDGRGW
jgi:glycosyltransferase involved in cell wall biosynthesis